MKESRQIVILAAGKGSRMKSDLPKVMHKINGKTMLRYVVDNSYSVSKDLILVYSDHIRDYLDQFPECKFAYQQEQLGTAHAMYSAFDLINHQKFVAVIYGDNPLISGELIDELFEYTHKEKFGLVTLAFEREEANQYGRIVVDENGKFVQIVEFKNANSEQKKIKLCNSGVMIFAPHILEKYLDKCLLRKENDGSREFYLTDIVEICSSVREKVGYYIPVNSDTVIGVNTQEELEIASVLASQIN